MNNINPIIMDALLKNNNMVTTSQIQELGFSKQTLHNYVKAGLLERILDAVNTISNIDLGDEIFFETISINQIRNDDIYGGFCVRINAIYDTIITPLSIDVSTGDVITPRAILYEFGGIFDENVQISLWGYNIETVMAEKAETILSRGVFNTRPRDYYDIYILSTTQSYNRQLFEEALSATAMHRGSAGFISNRIEIIERISESNDL